MRKGCFRGVLPPVKIHFCQRNSTIFSAQRDAQQRPWSDCIDAQNQIGLRSPQANFHIGSYIFFISVTEKSSDLNMNGKSRPVSEENKMYLQVSAPQRSAQTFYLTFTTLWAFSANGKLMIFLLFFQENRIWHFMQIVSWGDNLHEMSNPVLWEK